MGTLGALAVMGARLEGQAEEDAVSLSEVKWKDGCIYIVTTI